MDSSKPCRSLRLACPARPQIRTGNRRGEHRLVEDRKVAHWRDYLDPIAVFDAQGWPQDRRS